MPTCYLYTLLLIHISRDLFAQDEGAQGAEGDFVEAFQAGCVLHPFGMAGSVHNLEAAGQGEAQLKLRVDPHAFAQRRALAHREAHAGQADIDQV